MPQNLSSAAVMIGPLRVIYVCVLLKSKVKFKHAIFLLLLATKVHDWTQVR